MKSMSAWTLLVSALALTLFVVPESYAIGNTDNAVVMPAKKQSKKTVPQKKAVAAVSAATQTAIQKDDKIVAIKAEKKTVTPATVSVNAQVQIPGQTKTYQKAPTTPVATAAISTAIQSQPKEYKKEPQFAAIQASTAIQIQQQPRAYAVEENKIISSASMAISPNTTESYTAAETKPANFLDRPVIEFQQQPYKAQTESSPAVTEVPLHLLGTVASPAEINTSDATELRSATDMFSDHMPQVEIATSCEQVLEVNLADFIIDERSAASGSWDGLQLTLETPEHDIYIHNNCVPTATDGDATCLVELTPCLTHPEKIKRIEIGVAGLGEARFTEVDVSVLDADGNVIVASDPLTKNIKIIRTAGFAQPLILPLK